MINKEILEKYIAEKWIVSQTHPTLPLTIYNYSQSTQFERKWDEVTLACRGLVLDNEGNIIARPFKKFFNWEEIKDHPSFPASQFKLPHEIFDKEDGSLGIGFFYKGEFVIATRGSFASDQAIKAAEMMKKYYTTDTIHNFLELTFLFEIIYPENRIVVDYKGEEKLVLLGAVKTQTEEEVDFEVVELIASRMKMPLVKKWDSKLSFEEIKALNIDNKEGVVVKFPWGRMKIKFVDYVALHRILTNCSSYDIWENLLKFGELPKELFDKVPDEFYGWVRQVRDSIIQNFEWIENAARAEFKLIWSKMIKENNWSILEFLDISVIDQEFAKRVKGHKMIGLLFALKKMHMKQGRSAIKEVVLTKKRNDQKRFTGEDLLKISSLIGEPWLNDEIEINVDEKGHSILKIWRDRLETDEELLTKQTDGLKQAIWKMVKPDYSKPFTEKYEIQE